MDIQHAALLLLLLRIISDGFMLRVLAIQYPLLRAGNDPQVKTLRYVLLFFAIGVFLGNMIPIIVDIATIFADVERSSRTLNTVGLFYSFSNAITSVVSAVFFWLIYKVTGEETIKLEAERDALQGDNDALHAAEDARKKP